MCGGAGCRIVVLLESSLESNSSAHQPSGTAAGTVSADGMTEASTPPTKHAKDKAR